MKRKTEAKQPEYPKVFETFRQIGLWEVSNLTQKEPSSFNGIADYRKFRVTIELIDEPIEVLRARVQTLWDKCNNHHEWQCLQEAAERLGMGRLTHA